MFGGSQSDGLDHCRLMAKDGAKEAERERVPRLAKSPEDLDKAKGLGM